MRAELIEDGGEAALDAASFFRSPDFLAGEQTTHTLLLGPLAIPVLVRRDLPDGFADAISPYGYPGGSTSGPDLAAGPLDTAGIDWSGTGLVSAFIRDRIGPPPLLSGATERGTVQIHDPALPRAVRARLGEQARALSTAGWTVDRLDGPDSPAEALATFHRLYTETMVRTGASQRYFFDDDYFAQVMRFPHTWLLLAREAGAAPGDEGGIGAAAIAAVSDGLLHYYLGGTADAHLADSPFKLVVMAMLELADELRLPLNLGGGLAPGDGLERFKRGFANTTLPFRTYEIICDPDAYGQLASAAGIGNGPREEAAKNGFFPAYRRGS